MDEYLDQVRQASGDLWKGFKAFVNLKQDSPDEEWQKFIDYGEAMCKKYKDTKAYEYVRRYWLLIADEIEAASKGKRW